MQPIALPGIFEIRVESVLNLTGSNRSRLKHVVDLSVHADII